MVLVIIIIWSILYSKLLSRNAEPKQLIYRDFRNFYFESFKNDLLENMVTCDRSYDEFDRKITTVLNKLAPKKKTMALW